MNKISVFLVVAVIASIFYVLQLNVQEYTVVVSDNTEKKALEIKKGKTLCSDCSMMIRGLTYASQIVAPDGKTWFFDDLGCMARWLDKQVFKEDAVIWVYVKDTQRYIAAEDAHYTRDEITPIGYGFGAYERKIGGGVSFDTLKLYTIRGETYLNHYVKKLLSKNNKNNWIEQ